jgi:hypothetical protein
MSTGDVNTGCVHHEHIGVEISSSTHSAPKHQMKESTQLFALGILLMGNAPLIPTKYNVG